MKSLFIGAICFLISLTLQGQWVASLHPTKSLTRKSLEFAVIVRNESDLDAGVSIFRSVTFVGLAGKPIGNYILELQKSDGYRFSTLNPTSDIDPVYVKEDSILIECRKSFSDTLRIDSRLFRVGSGNLQEFLPGSYRLKVSYRPFQFDLGREFLSDWFSFTLE